MTASLASVDTLRETEGRFVAKTSRGLIADDGSVFITDQAQGQVLVFSTTGELVRAIGRAGRGPGELLGPTAMALWGKDSLVVADVSLRRISVFRRSDGAFLWHTLGLGSVSSLGAVGERLVVASLQPGAFTTVGLLDPGEQSLRPALPMSDPSLAERYAWKRFPRSVIGTSSGMLVVGVLWSDVVSVYDSALALAYTFALPRTQRRPIPANLDEELMRLAGTTADLVLFPSLVSIETLGQGRVAFIHNDWMPPLNDSQPGATLRVGEMRAYATVVDLEQRRACADIRLPSDWTEIPRFSGDGDQLAGIGHVIGDGARPVLELRRFDLRLESCDWLPLQTVTPQATPL